MKNTANNLNPLSTFHFDDRTYKSVVTYAREAVQYYATFGRSQGDIIKHIVLGKLGEIAYYYQFRNYIQNGTAHILKINKPEKGRAWGTDLGYDFILEDGTTIDVKSVELGKKKVYFNEPFKADCLSVVLVDPLLRKGQYVTTLTREEMDSKKVLFKESGKRKVYSIEFKDLDIQLNFIDNE